MREKNLSLAVDKSGSHDSPELFSQPEKSRSRSIDVKSSSMITACLFLTFSLLSIVKLQIHHNLDLIFSEIFPRWAEKNNNFSFFVFLKLTFCSKKEAEYWTASDAARQRIFRGFFLFGWAHAAPRWRFYDDRVEAESGPKVVKYARSHFRASKRRRLETHTAFNTRDQNCGRAAQKARKLNAFWWTTPKLDLAAVWKRKKKARFNLNFKKRTPFLRSWFPPLEGVFQVFICGQTKLELVPTFLWRFFY